MKTRILFALSLLASASLAQAGNISVSVLNPGVSTTVLPAPVTLTIDNGSIVPGSGSSETGTLRKGS